MSASPLPSSLGRGRFTPTALLGEGAFGAVYSCVDQRTETICAVKSLRRLDLESVRRFKQEFRSLATLAHPGLVAMYELYVADGEHLLVMERVEGVDFLSWVCDAPRAAARMSTGQLGSTQTRLDETLLDARSSDTAITLRNLPSCELARLVPAARELAQALGFLHQRGLLHRDVKPGNVLVTHGGSVRLLDFGLASTLGDASSPSAGTPAYIAPEQVGSAGRLTPACDWYAFGVMLYEALSGRLPYDGSAGEVLLAKRELDPPPLEAPVDCPLEIRQLVTGLLRREPEQRPEFEQILEALGGARPSWAPGASAAVELIGRSEQLRALEAGADSGRRAMLLVGEPGIGKTALAEAFVARSGAQPTLSGRCLHSQTVAYNAFDPLMDQLAALMYSSRVSLSETGGPALGRLFPCLSPFVPSHELERLAPAEERRRGFEELRCVLGLVTRAQPLMLVLDDFHWADADSQRLLVDLLQGDLAGVRFLLTMRSDVAACQLLISLLQQALGDTALVVEVPGLAAAQGAELAARLWRQFEQTGSVPDVEVARGNPFLIEAYLRVVLDAGRVALPSSGAALLALRLESLVPAEREVLELLAVARRPLSQRVLASAIRDPEGARTLFRRLELSHWLKASEASAERLEIGQAAIADAVLAALDVPATRHVHGALAELLFRFHPDQIEDIALALHGASELSRALPYLLEAAAAASRSLAFSRAARLYELSLDAPCADAAERRRLLVLRADAYANAGFGDDAADAFEAAAGHHEGFEALDLRRRGAEQLLGAGHIDRGLRAMDALLRCCELDFPDSRLGVLYELLKARVALYGRVDPYALARDKKDSARDRLSIDVAWSACAGMALVDPARAAIVQTHGLIIALDAGDAARAGRLIGLESMTLAAFGYRAKARIAALCERIDGIAQESGDLHLIGVSLAARGISAVQLGEMAVGRQACGAALSHIRSSLHASSWEITSLLHFFTFSLYHLGEIKALCRAVPDGIRDADVRGDLHLATDLRTGYPNLAILLESGPARARQEANLALQRWSRSGFHAQHYYAAQAFLNINLAEGRPDVALAEYDAAWKKMKKALLLMIEGIRIDARFCRVRALLAARQDARRRGDRLTARRYTWRLQADAWALQREAAPWGRALGDLAWALVAEAERIDALTRAVERLHQLSLGVYAWPGEHRLGGLLGGSAGEARQRAARAALAEQGIADVEHWIGVILPGAAEPPLRAKASHVGGG